jgi:hypothetical protein
LQQTHQRAWALFDGSAVLTVMRSGNSSLGPLVKLEGDLGYPVQASNSSIIALYNSFPAKYRFSINHLHHLFTTYLHCLEGWQGPNALERMGFGLYSVIWEKYISTIVVSFRACLPSVMMDPSSLQVRLLSGRWLDYEVAGGQNKDEINFATLIRYTSDAPMGKATALIHIPSASIEVTSLKLFVLW